jgi:hypothetical protein
MVDYFKQNKNGEMCCCEAVFIGDARLLAAVLRNIINVVARQ